jgi:hypothetical protein
VHIYGHLILFWVVKGIQIDAVGVCLLRHLQKEVVFDLLDKDDKDLTDEQKKEKKKQRFLKVWPD